MSKMVRTFRFLRMALFAYRQANAYRYSCVERQDENGSPDMCIIVAVDSAAEKLSEYFSGTIPQKVVFK